MKTNKDVCEALEGLTFICKTLGYLEVVPPYGDSKYRIKQCDKAIEQCEKIRALLQTPSDESLRKELEQAKAKQKELMSSHAELLEAADFLLFSLHDLEKYQEVALPNNAIWFLKQAITNAEALINALGTNVTEKLLEGK